MAKQFYFTERQTVNSEKEYVPVTADSLSDAKKIVKEKQSYIDTLLEIYDEDRYLLSYMGLPDPDWIDVPQD